MRNRYIYNLLNYIINKRLLMPVVGFILGFILSGVVFEYSKWYGGNIKTVVGENTITTCFTPPKGCARLIRDVILTAKKDLYIQAYGFTHPDIIEAILYVAKKGVDVVIILDRSNVTSKYSGLKRCFEAGVPVFIDTVSSISHNKVIIVDHKNDNDASLITGSFNFSKNADTRNAENVLFIKQKKLVDIYKDNFDIRLGKSIYYLDYLKKYQKKR